MAKTFVSMAVRSPSPRNFLSSEARLMPTTIPTNWPWRLLGVAVVLLCVVFYEPAQGGLFQRLLLPIIMGISAVFIVQNLLAVVLAGSLLAGIHSNWSMFSITLANQVGTEQWIDGFAYPVVTIICVITAAAILVKRFRAHIRATHDARWQARANQQDE